MPMRAHVGSGDGVTKASMTPLTSSTTARPRPRRRRTGPRRRASGRGSRPRVDPRPEQPQADAGGDEDRRQLEQPVRQDQPEEQVAAVVRIMIAPISATLRMF